MIPAVSGGYLLFEVAALLLVDQNQVEVVAHGELLIHVPHGGRHLVAGQEQPDGDGLSWKGNRRERLGEGMLTECPQCWENSTEINSV